MLRSPAGATLGCVSATEAGLLLAVFAACAVEAVEAATIVLAIGTVRGWSSAWAGTAAGLGVLAVVVAALGPALTAIPIGVLRLVVGGLLLTFGLQWLRKAVLRAGGVKALSDEDVRFARERGAALAQGDRRASGIDPYGFAVSFKGVLLEGLEVAFIVVTFGASDGHVAAAAATAVAAVLVVAGAVALARAPLRRVPENTLKFAVGVMLTSFGMFWGVEGAGANWPGGEAALPGVIAWVALVALGLAAVLRRRTAGAPQAAGIGA
jgi:MYXO-CTERM domain-containing protein